MTRCIFSSAFQLACSAQMPAGGVLFDGDISPVVAACAPFASSPDFVVYPTDMSKSTVDVGKIMSCKGLIRAIAAIHPRLTFSQDDWKGILTALAQKQKHVWLRALNPLELQSFLDIMGKRLRTMMSHINKARSRHGGSDWVRELLGTAGCKPTRLSGKQAPAWVHDFDWQLCQAYRFPIGRPDNRQPADSLSSPAGAENPVASFSDEQIVIKAVTCGELDELRQKQEQQQEKQQRLIARRPAVFKAAVTAAAASLAATAAAAAEGAAQDVESSSAPASAGREVAPWQGQTPDGRKMVLRRSRWY